MPASQALIAAGMNVSFADFSAEILDINGYGATRQAVDCTHQNSPNYWEESKPSPYKKAATITISCAFGGSFDPKTLIGGAASTLTITEPIPDGGTAGATWACTAFVTSVTKTGQRGQRMTADVVFELSGEPVFTAGT